MTTRINRGDRNSKKSNQGGRKEEALKDRKEKERGCPEYKEADGTPFVEDHLLNETIPVAN